MFFVECLRNFESSFSSASMGWLKLTENTGNSLYYGSKWERTDSIWQTASDQHVDSAPEVKAKGWTATRPGHVHCSCPSFSWFQQLAISTFFSGVNHKNEAPLILLANLAIAWWADCEGPMFLVTCWTVQALLSFYSCFVPAPGRWGNAGLALSSAHGWFGVTMSMAEDGMQLS